MGRRVGTFVTSTCKLKSEATSGQGVLTQEKGGKGMTSLIRTEPYGMLSTNNTLIDTFMC